MNYRYQKVLEYYCTNQKYRNLVSLKITQAYRRYREEMESTNPKKFNPKTTLSDSQIQEYIEKTPEFYLIYPKPSWKTTIIMILLSYPFEFLLHYFKFLYHIIKCNFLKMPMDEKDKIFFTCKALNIKKERFDVNFI